MAKEGKVKMERSTAAQVMSRLDFKDFRNPLDVYDFMQQLINDGVDIDEMYDVKCHYDCYLDELLKDEPNEDVLYYCSNVMYHKLKKYGYLHTTYAQNKKYGAHRYGYYWNPFK